MACAIRQRYMWTWKKFKLKLSILFSVSLKYEIVSILIPVGWITPMTNWKKCWILETWYWMMIPCSFISCYTKSNTYYLHSLLLLSISIPLTPRYLILYKILYEKNYLNLKWFVLPSCKHLQTENVLNLTSQFFPWNRKLETCVLHL